MAAKVLVIGSGGREHALAWALSRSAAVSQVIVAPGNGGTVWSQDNGTGLRPHVPCTSVNISSSDFTALIDYVQTQQVDLTVVGPEVPLSEGIVDAFQAQGLAIFGPSQAAARIEASKAYAKDFMQRYHIPTAAYGVFTDYAAARDFLHTFDRPVVVKASGLAAGKGVLICDTLTEAEAALKNVLQDRAFGAAGDEVIIEERLTGREVSLLAFCDGQTVVPMVTARDYKRALEGDAGLNTGGMGAFAPAADISPVQIDVIQETVLRPTVAGMAAEGHPYIGVLYAGLMLTDDGLKVLEFNCRFGDPETQVILPLLDTDLYEIFHACIAGRLHEIDIQWQTQACATVVLAAPGYPQSYPTGLPISGLDTVTDDQLIVFHAGTERRGDEIVTNGGRVLNVTAVGTDLSSALDHAYSAVDKIHFENMHFRRDIGRLS